MVVTKSTEGVYPLEVFYIPDRFMKKAEDELKETSENREIALEQLRELVLSDSDLSCRTSDEFLLQFLRARKYNVPKAYHLLKKYVNFRRKNVSIFTGMDYDELHKLVESRTLGLLPSRCPDGCVVFAARLNNWSPSEASIEVLSRGIVLFLYHSINDPLTQVNGYKVILDAKSHPLKHLRFCTPHNICLLYNGTQECFPGRFKGIHIINMSLTFKAAWTLIQPFLSEKLKKRIIFHENNDTLTDYFPASMLPVSFGGQLTDYDSTTWLKNALQPEHLDRLAN
ncbi:retinaldehyde-binding protein 1-like [Uloborus diversus]|uniref:retinaldehyde-binding protein 1-like n=1 Tax=Uloborus diversus TaxID=327109 RepID=UPI002409F040|nr:retinaldehyde-binding protein 1-like [Uloborus diversus]